MKFGVVVFPSKKLQDIANSYRKRYDPHYSLIPPHLTLKPGFEATEDEAVQLALKLRNIASKYEPFLLKASKISSFKPVNNVIYFKIDPIEQLTKLQAEINQEFSSQNSGYAFVPHITIGQELTDAEHSDVYGQLRMMSVDLEETVDRFHLLYQLENGSWTVYETFRLGKDL